MISPARAMAIWRCTSYSRARSTERKLFMFLISVLTPRACCPRGRIEMLASQRRLPSSIRPEDTPRYTRISRSFVVNGRGKESSYRNNTGLSRSFHAKRAKRRGSLDVLYLDSWYLRRRWQQVIHKAGIDQLSIFIVHQPLIESSTDALRHPSMHLPFHDHRINYSATIVNRGVLQERDHACGRINLDNGSMHSTGKTCVERAVELGRL